MKKLSLTLGGLLMATTALVAPGLALAQSQPDTDPAPIEGEATAVDEIVVLGVFIPVPQRESAEVAAFLTEEDLARTGDSNAAQALTRVTGLSVVEGRFVYVRGLGERYSSALLNGSPLPSPEPLQRVVPLDLFPASVLEGVAVQKTYSARYPGEFGGGVIDLETLSIPNDNFFTLGLEVGGNTDVTFQEGLIYYGSRTDFTGFDDGTRDVPGLLREAIATGNRVVSGANFTAAEIQAIGRDFVNAPLNLLQTTEYVPADFGFEVNAGRSWDVWGGQLGAIVVLDYDNEWRNRDGVQQTGFNDLGTLRVDADYITRSTQNDVAWNLLGSLGFEWGNNALQWTNLYVRRTTKEARYREGFTGTSSIGTGRDVRREFTAWYARQLFSTQITGEHAFGDLLEWNLDWRAAYAVTERDAPYERYVDYSYTTTGGVREYAFDQNQGNLIRFSEVNDNVLSGGADLSYTLPLSDVREAVFTVGVAYSENERDAVVRDFSFRASSIPDDVRRQRVDFLFSDFNIGPDLFELREVTGQNGAAAYDGTLEVAAGYLQVDADIFPLVRLSAGVRYEDGEQTVRPFDLFGGVAALPTTSISESYWLPAATITWNFAEDMQLRFGASQTIGRPQFRELAEQIYLDPESDRSFRGNPFLVNTEILNLDARYEWYFDRNQYLTVGAFYKDLENPVEAILLTAEQSYVNAPSAMLYGLEVDFRRYFDMQTGMGWIDERRWFVQANYTYTDSEVEASDGDTVTLPDNTLTGRTIAASGAIVDGSRLQGQSEHLANLQFGWENELSGSQATLLVTYVSERISARGDQSLGAASLPDFIQEPGTIVDFVYRQPFNLDGREYRFGFEARNLLGTEFEEYQELGGDRIDINRYDLGTSFEFSIATDF